MGRITRRVEEDGVKAIYINEKAGEDFECFLENEYGYKTVDKLAAYEDIIDSPEKLKLIDELYLERCEKINRLNKELEEYKKLEEEGLLLRLPCKEGADIYYILGVPNKTPCVIESCTFELSDIHRIGKTLFLTQEEAEQALADMKGK